MFWRLCLVLGLAGTWLPMFITPALAQAPCDPPNILWNCNFDAFSGSPPRQVPTGWTPFVLEGDLAFMQDVDTVFGAPSLRMWSDGGTFKAGIHTRVGNVQQGVAYKASLGWAAPNAPDAFGRQLGIDPTGGTDPTAPTVIWGAMHRGPGRIVNYPPGEGPNIDVSAVAQAETITLFILVDHNYSTGDNYIFLDAITMFVDPVQPTATPVPPTATAVLPTPTPPQPTATLTPSATPTVTATRTQTPRVLDTLMVCTATPTATLTPTATVRPSPTPSATFTPIPIRLPSPVAIPTQAQEANQIPTEATRSQSGAFLAAGLSALGAAGLLGGAIFRLWRRDRQRPNLKL